MAQDVNKFFEGLMGLGDAWEIYDTRPPSDGDEFIHISIRTKPLVQFKCPRCGASCSVYDHTRERTWRNTDVLSYPTQVHARIPRVDCRRCGVVQAEVPWAGPYGHFTLVMEAMIRSLIQELPVSTTAAMMRVDDKAVMNVAHMYAERLRDNLDLSDLTRVGADERSLNRDEVATVFHNMDSGNIIFAVKGKGADTIGEFAVFLEAHKGKVSRITDFSTDFGGAYISGIRRWFKRARITVDRFHLVKMANEAVSNTRCSTIGLAINRLKLKYLLMRNRENLDEGGRAALKEALDNNPVLSEAYSLKEYLLETYNLSYEDASIHLDRFVSAASASNASAMRKLSRTVERFKTEILNRFLTGLSNGHVEGVNNLLNKVKARSYGFRSMENFIDMIWVVASHARTDFYGKPRPR